MCVCVFGGGVADANLSFKIMVLLSFLIASLLKDSLGFFFYFPKSSK